MSDAGRAEPLRNAANGLAAHFESIRPRAFLDDITTKNVLIHEGNLAGIVDVDEICFGDRIAPIGLTKASLLSRGFVIDYIDYWSEALHLNEVERKALDFYAAASAFCFLAEQGQRFNRDGPVSVNTDEVRKLESLFDELIVNVG